MRRQTPHSELGSALRRARKAHQHTQIFMANTARLSVQTVRNLERGRGTLASLDTLLTALALELRGRNLPAGSSLAAQLTALRRKRGLSQRDLAEITHVAPGTIVALERTGRGRVETLDRVLQTLGAGAYLAARNERRAFFSHAGNQSTHHGWHTPRSLLERLYGVFGTFDLDPCSPFAHRRRAPVRARVHFVPGDDGLTLPWFGTVFVNPPYGRVLRSWVEKAHSEVGKQRAGTVVALLPARTDTRWWHEHVAHQADVFILRGRLAFGAGDQAAPFPSALVLWGATDELRAAMRTAFPEAWHLSP
jgi:phage N-6-adenine-methyltransferase